MLAVETAQEVICLILKVVGIAPISPEYYRQR